MLQYTYCVRYMRCSRPFQHYHLTCMYRVYAYRIQELSHKDAHKCLCSCSSVHIPVLPYQQAPRATGCPVTHRRAVESRDDRSSRSHSQRSHCRYSQASIPPQSAGCYCYYYCYYFQIDATAETVTVLCWLSSYPSWRGRYLHRRNTR
jgi:hypothetical protein